MSVMVLLALGVVVVVVIAVVGFHLEQKRRDRVLAYALGRAWRYDRRGPVAGGRLAGRAVRGG